MTQDT